MGISENGTLGECLACARKDRRNCTIVQLRIPLYKHKGMFSNLILPTYCSSSGVNFDETKLTRPVEEIDLVKYMRIAKSRGEWCESTQWSNTDLRQAR